MLAPLFSLLILASAAPACSPLSGVPGTTPQLRGFWSGCPFELVSPDKSKTLVVDENVHVHVIDRRSGRPLPVRMRGPLDELDASWSPSSRAFFFAHYSAVYSMFRMVRWNGRGFVEAPQFAKIAKAVYRRRNPCHDRSKEPQFRGFKYVSEDPAVWGVGWSRRGDRVYVVVENGPHDMDCGDHPRLVGLQMNVSDASVVRVFGEAEALAMFTGTSPKP